MKQISKIAVTCRPGLIGCLGVGIGIAKTLGLVWGIPVYGVNHLRAHALSPFMTHGSSNLIWADNLPHLGLLVSGAIHYFEICSKRMIKIVGRTRDDAVGEALDKGAKLLGIPYPGGAELEKRARDGDPNAYSFPRAFDGKSKDDFSFRPETSLLYTLQKMSTQEINGKHADLCASYQEAAIDQLAKKCGKFLQGNSYKVLGFLEE